MKFSVKELESEIVRLSILLGKKDAEIEKLSKQRLLEEALCKETDDKETVDRALSDSHSQQWYKCGITEKKGGTTLTRAELEGIFDGWMAFPGRPDLKTHNHRTFRDPEEFSEERKKYNLSAGWTESNGMRQTGRTTQIVLKAIQIVRCDDVRRVIIETTTLHQVDRVQNLLQHYAKATHIGLSRVSRIEALTTECIRNRKVNLRGGPLYKGIVNIQEDLVLIKDNIITDVQPSQPSQSSATKGPRTLLPGDTVSVIRKTREGNTVHNRVVNGKFVKVSGGNGMIQYEILLDTGEILNFDSETQIAWDPLTTLLDLN
jgi:hypothetical protein